MLSYKVYLDKANIIDILNHNYLAEQLPFIKKKCFKYNKLVDEKSFREEVRQCLFYQYCGRFEYERGICDNWKEYVEKVDVYKLAMINFDLIIEYLINHIKEIK